MDEIVETSRFLEKHGIKMFKEDLIKMVVCTICGKAMKYKDRHYSHNKLCHKSCSNKEKAERYISNQLLIRYQGMEDTAIDINSFYNEISTTAKDYNISYILAAHIHEKAWERHLRNEQVDEQADYRG